MIRSIPLQQLTAAVDSNLPAGTIIFDRSGNSATFYKYKGTLVERDSLEFNLSTLRSRVKHAVNRGSTLAIKIHHEDDISGFIERSAISPELFNRNKITTAILDTYMDSRDDYVVLQDDFRIVFIIQQEIIPNCLQRYVDIGDLIPIRID